MTRPTTSRFRRLAENVGMAILLSGARAGVRRGSVQRMLTNSERLADSVRRLRPFSRRDDTLLRARALAYRWSDRVPGATCLHRALATRVWLAAFGLESRIVLGFRREEGLAGHAWLEVDSGGGVIVLFHEEPDGYVVAMTG